MMFNLFAVTIAIIAFFISQGANAYDNGVGTSVPIRGWTNWCTNDLCGLRDKCSEFEVRKRADALVESGLKDLGYKWILLDDCWSDHERDANGNLQPNKFQFPSGMKALGDYLHERDLKLGIYTCIGTETCKKNRPGSYGHYEQDANTLASWGADMVKSDYCHTPNTGETGKDLYTQFSKALNATGRPMLFAICNWGLDDVSDWGPGIAQQFRIQMDHIPFYNWPPPLPQGNGVGYGQGTKDIINFMADLHPSKTNGPHQWMDPDFLETLFDPYSMTFIDSRTEFTFWALWSSPLLVATDVYNMTEQKRSILMNKEVLAVHEDPLWISGERIYNMKDGAQAWQRPLSNGDFAVVLYNSAELHNISASIRFSDLSYGGKTYNLRSQFKVRDLWLQEDVGTFRGEYRSPLLVPHDQQMLRLTPIN